MLIKYKNTYICECGWHGTHFNRWDTRCPNCRNNLIKRNVDKNNQIYMSTSTASSIIPIIKIDKEDTIWIVNENTLTLSVLNKIKYNITLDFDTPSNLRILKDGVLIQNTKDNISAASKGFNSYCSWYNQMRKTYGKGSLNTVIEFMINHPMLMKFFSETTEFIETKYEALLSDEIIKNIKSLQNKYPWSKYYNISYLIVNISNLGIDVISECFSEANKSVDISIPEGSYEYSQQSRKISALASSYIDLYKYGYTDLGKVNRYINNELTVHQGINKDTGLSKLSQYASINYETGNTQAILFPRDLIQALALVSGDCSNRYTLSRETPEVIVNNNIPEEITEATIDGYIYNVPRSITELMAAVRYLHYSISGISENIEKLNFVIISSISSEQTPDIPLAMLFIKDKSVVMAKQTGQQNLSEELKVNIEKYMEQILPSLGSIFFVIKKRATH